MNVSIVSSNDKAIPAANIKIEVVEDTLKLIVGDVEMAGNTDLIVNVSDGVTIVSCIIRLTVCSNKVTPVSSMLVDQINVYPIPVKDELTLDFGNDLSKRVVNFVIHDQNGRIIYQKLGSVDEQSKINVKDLNDGLYILSIYHSGALLRIFKIIILK